MPSYGIGRYASTLVNPAGGGAGYGGGEFVSPRKGRITSPYGGAAGGAAGGIIPGNINAPQMPYQPGAPAAAATAGMLKSTGAGLLDPGSAYGRRMREELTGQIGQETGARKRLAALEAARSGYGTGESSELLSTLGDIDVAGLEATGEGLQDLILKSPELALQFLTPAMEAELGISRQDLEAWIEQQRIQQRGQEIQQTGELGWAGLGLERERLGQNSMMNQLSLLFGGM